MKAKLLWATLMLTCFGALSQPTERTKTEPTPQLPLPTTVETVPIETTSNERSTEVKENQQSELQNIPTIKTLKVEAQDAKALEKSHDLKSAKESDMFILEVDPKHLIDKSDYARQKDYKKAKPMHLEDFRDRSESKDFRDRSELEDFRDRSESKDFRDNSEKPQSHPETDTDQSAIPNTVSYVIFKPLDGTQSLGRYDSRFEIESVLQTSDENKKVVSNSFSVFGVTSTDQLLKTTTGYTVPYAVNLKDRFGLCPSEPYGSQPVLCIGTAFLVAKDIVLTARHNLNSVPLKKMAFVIGFKVLIKTRKANLDFGINDVYRASSIIPSDRLEKLDLALIKLDRPVNQADVLSLSNEPGNDVHLKDPIYSLGYPLGLPMKYITNASVFRIDGYNFFTTLDTFKGNSGSPVFSRITHKVVGVLVEGGIDLKSNGNCMVSNLCDERTCEGERVIDISWVRNDINKLISSSKK